MTVFRQTYIITILNHSLNIPSSVFIELSEIFRFLPTFTYQCIYKIVFLKITILLSYLIDMLNKTVQVILKFLTDH